MAKCKRSPEGRRFLKMRKPYYFLDTYKTLIKFHVGLVPENATDFAQIVPRATVGTIFQSSQSKNLYLGNVAGVKSSAVFYI